MATTMNCEYKSFSRVVFLFIFICYELKLTSTCAVEGGKYDLSPLSRFQWNVTKVRGPHLVEYKINLCSPLRINDSCSNSSICQVESKDGSLEIANLGSYETVLKAHQNASENGFWLKFKGGSCPLGDIRRTLINFQCSEHLGSPILIGVFGCKTYFLWESSIACSQVRARIEVPCYTHDSQGNKYDLSSLIRTKGGYSIKSRDKTDIFYFNVCSDIAKEEASTVGCPTGAGACRIIGNNSQSFGSATGQLVLSEDGKLQMSYNVEEGQIPPECSTQPHTTINFLCPSAGSSQKPVILSSTGCHYQIEWPVVQACPVKQLESSNGCTIISDSEGLKIDLSPLAPLYSNPKIPQHAQGMVNGKLYDYYFGICTGLPLNYSCADNTSSSTRICRKSLGDYRGTIFGTSINQTLSYAENQLIGSYTGGSVCKLNGSTNQQYSTVIFFKCNLFSKNNGNGEPRFVLEDDCVTFFEWETQYACMESICSTKSGENIIDLSSLTKGLVDEPWLSVSGSSDTDGLLRIYINVCGPVQKTVGAKNCPVGAAVCVKDKDGAMLDFGRFVTRPAIELSTLDVLLNYSSSEFCSSGANRTSVIRFVCQPGVINLGPQLIHASDDGCLLEFEWPTAAACIQAAIEGDNCQIKNPALGFLDLMPLQKDTYYSVLTEKYSFYLSVCNSIKGAPCQQGNDNIAACQMDNQNRSKIWSLGKPSSKLMYQNGLVNITYTNGSLYNLENQTSRQTVIMFACDWNAGIGNPTFEGETNWTYNFIWKTSYVCPPRPIECIYVDESTQTQYDLSRLTRSSGQNDWEVNDPRGNLKFYINVCRSLTHVGISDGKCDSQAGICATNVDKGKESTYIYNLGKAKSGPHLEEGQLVLSYISGNPCPSGNNGQNYSSTIYFICSNDSVTSRDDKGLEYLRELHCEYMFLWNTVSACPLRNAEISKSCSIEDPNGGVTYSLESLQTSYYIPIYQEMQFQSFDISICGVLNTSICGPQHANISSSMAACGRLSNSDQSVVLGLNDSRRLRVSKQGIVSAQFDGPVNVTSGKPDYQIEVSFLCHRNFESPNPTFVRKEGHLFMFEYETAITCQPQEIECTCNDGRGSIYDLSSLGFNSGPWEVHDPRPEKLNTVYYLNVCKGVKTLLNSNCSVGMVGACEKDLSTGKSWSLGQIQGRPQVSSSGKDTVTLKYLNGDLCQDGRSHRSTHINFICSTKQAGPQFIEETEQCNYIFSWETPAACPLKQTIGKNCKVTESVYSSSYDFNKLVNASGYTVISGNKIFKINLCSPLNIDCGGDKEAGVCVETDGHRVSAGTFSNELVYNHGEITLKYEGTEKASLIVFLCDYTTTGKQGPILINSSSDDSFYVFSWKTSYACNSFKDSICSTVGPNNTLYDLSSLTLFDSNHECITNDGKYKYLINVCRSIVHGKDAQCHYGAAVCEVNLTEANVEKKYSTIGEVGTGPELVNGVLKVIYDIGELCENANTSLLHKRAVIEFYCSPYNSVGSPLFLSVEQCEYRFAWYTSAACPIIQEDTVGGDCTTTNPNTGYKFDLNVLRNTSYIVESVDYKFTLGICEGAPNNPCGVDVGSCQQDLKAKSMYYNAGKANSNLHYRNGLLLLNYTNWDPCPHVSGSDVWTTIISFVCGQSKLGPSYIGVTGCLYLFEWHTDLACEKQVHCSVEVDDEMFDLGPIGEFEGNHFAFSSDENDTAMYILNVCRPLNRYFGVQCASEAAACRLNPTSKDAYASSLGYAETSPTVDAQGHITLEYMKGGSPCPFNPRLNASSRIIFKCDDRLIHGVLQMVEVTPECTYVFEWPTNLVCPKITHGILSPNCSYIDKRSQRNFDLAQLNAFTSNSYTVDSEDGKFKISLCGPVTQQGQCSSAGVCLERDGKQESWGSSLTKTIAFDGSILKVTFKDGNPCPLLGSGNVFSSVLFVCDFHAGSGRPELTERSECSVLFTWKTSMVCSKPINQCNLMHQGSLYDLSLLSSYSHSWTVDVSGDEKFWINVCGTVGDKSDVRCPKDSAICWKTAAGKVMSIGTFQNQQLYMDDDGKTLLLRYSTSTNVCFHGPNNSGLPTWSEIRFKCSPITKKVQFVSRGTQFNSCTFIFQWETPVACPERRRLGILEKYGKLEDSNIGLYIDISTLLAKNATAIEKRDQDEYMYHIALWGLSNYKNGKCDGAAICQTKTDDTSFQRNIGKVDDMKFYLQGSEIIVILQSSSQCGRNTLKNATSHIILQCSISAGIGLPEFVFESLDCNYIFTWQTDVVCDPVLLYPLDAEPMDADLHSSSNVGVAVGITCIVIVIAITLFVIFRKQSRRICNFLSCESLSTISSSLATSNRQGSSSISFARLTEEEANS